MQINWAGLLQGIDGADTEGFEMFKIHRRDSHIFQISHGGVQTVTQRHGFSHASRVGQQFTSLFANLVVEWHGI